LLLLMAAMVAQPTLSVTCPATLSLAQLIAFWPHGQMMDPALQLVAVATRSRSAPFKQSLHMVVKHAILKGSGMWGVRTPYAL
jgi:hypothetical protein